MIAQGVRFNAEKKQVGNYYSTKVWYRFLTRQIVVLFFLCIFKFSFFRLYYSYSVAGFGDFSAEMWLHCHEQSLRLPLFMSDFGFVDVDK